MSKLKVGISLLWAVCFSFLLSSPVWAAELRVFISVDMEGISGVVNTEQTGGSEFSTARKWMADDVNAAVQGALEAGATEIVVVDAHGSGCNMLLSDLNPAVNLVSGSSGLHGMMEGISKNFDAAMFVGYHARAGTTEAVLDHTSSGSKILETRVNGIEMPELGLSALFAGAFGVPVVLVTGDTAVCAQAQKLLGDRVAVAAVKEGIGRYSARLLPFQKAHDLIREQSRQGLARRKQISPYTLKAPYTFDVSFFRAAMADNVMLLSGMARTGPRNIRFVADDFISGFKLYRAVYRLGTDD
jgi:D-amino peptidase